VSFGAGRGGFWRSASNQMRLLRSFSREQADFQLGESGHQFRVVAEADRSSVKQLAPITFGKRRLGAGGRGEGKFLPRREEPRPLKQRQIPARFIMTGGVPDASRTGRMVHDPQRPLPGDGVFAGQQLQVHAELA